MSEVTIWYLQSRAADELKPSADPGDVVITEARIRQYQFNRFLYEFVGGPWQWTDKLSWTDAQWRAYAEAENLRTWVAYCDGAPAGYFEMQKTPDASVEICYFGLAEKFFGRGFGGYLLTEAIRRAWDWEASRVSVNTCSLDHPSALANYQARGMSVYRTENRELDQPRRA